jgi:hypothetical protein
MTDRATPCPFRFGVVGNRIGGSRAPKRRATTVEELVDEQVVAESEFRIVREEGEDSSTGGVVR